MRKLFDIQHTPQGLELSVSGLDQASIARMHETLEKFSKDTEASAKMREQAIRAREFLPWTARTRTPKKGARESLREHTPEQVLQRQPS